MHTRQFCTPHLVTPQGATPLERVPLGDRTHSEKWFQELLYANPSLIPIDEIEEVFGPLIPLARELPTSPGRVDVAYISPSGYITLVETKLFRNPEARRQVVAQIVSYAAAMSQWTYADLCDAVRLARRIQGTKAGIKQSSEASDADPILSLVRDEVDFDEARFIDAVTKNIAQGRFLLLVAGDGIQHGVEQLADTLSSAPALGFSFALMEMAVFKAGEAKGSYFVQPRVLARTREIVRAVVEVRPPATPADVRVTVPTVNGGAGGGRRLRLSEEAIFERIAESLGKSFVDQFRGFLSECEKLGLESEAMGTSLSLIWNEPNTGRRFSFASVFADGGTVSLKYAVHNYRKSGLDQKIGMEYVGAVAALVPGARVRENVKDGKAWPRIYVDQREITLADLMPKAREWVDAIAAVIAATEEAGANKVARP